MEWETCCSQRLVKEVMPDNNLIDSLKQSSRDVIKTNETIALNETTASTKVSLMYDSVRELLEARRSQKDLKFITMNVLQLFLRQNVAKRISLCNSTGLEK